MACLMRNAGIPILSFCVFLAFSRLKKSTTDFDALPEIFLPLFL